VGWLAEAIACQDCAHGPKQNSSRQHAFDPNAGLAIGLAGRDPALVFVSPDGLGLAEAAPAAPLRFDNVGDLDIRDALVLASRRIGHDACADLATRTRGSVLRPEQAKILDDFANFLRDVAGGSIADAVSRTLVEQTVRELDVHAPGISVGRLRARGLRWPVGPGIVRRIPRPAMSCPSAARPAVLGV
jgi:hypothetical protein